MSEDAHTSLRAAVDVSLETTPRLDRDAAVSDLARFYADLLDDARDRLSDAAEEEEHRAFGQMVTVIAKIGPRLENTLGLLGMAPGARPVRPEGGPDDPTGPALEQLRDDAAGAAAAGVDYSAAVDPAVAEADAGD